MEFLMERRIGNKAKGRTGTEEGDFRDVPEISSSRITECDIFPFLSRGHWRGFDH